MTPRARRVVELGQQVDAATHLEGSGGQEIVVLHPHLGAHQPVQGWIVTQGAAIEVTPDMATSIEDIGQGRRAQFAW